jgi:hypothetical protein
VTTADIMRAAMLGKVGGFTKALPTNFAHQRLLSGVRAHMHGESTLLLEASAAALMFTFPWLLARMGAHVLLERLFCGKHYATDIALYWLVYGCRCQYMFQDKFEILG